MPVIRVMISDINTTSCLGPGATGNGGIRGTRNDGTGGTGGTGGTTTGSAPANSGPATGGLDLRKLLDLEGLFSADGMSRPESTMFWDLDLPDLIASLPKANNY
ncbi:hypothetical protein CRV24_001043 [Beauveria bassiana]|nr:hypothetical protein CRV24_001043 [Beauveria bassiana]KAH8720386.1 hypothetical protein HC256_000781 [Beauveria bassiana]